MNDYMHRVREDGEGYQWKVHARAGRKVEAIKEFRSRYGAGLKEAKDVVEAYCETLKGAVVQEILFPGGWLTIKSDGSFNEITITKVHAKRVHKDSLLQAVADLILKYGRE